MARAWTRSGATVGRARPRTGCHPAWGEPRCDLKQFEIAVQVKEGGADLKEVRCVFVYNCQGGGASENGRLRRSRVRWPCGYHWTCRPTIG